MRTNLAIAFGMLSMAMLFTSLLESTTKPLTIINATGLDRQIYVAYAHNLTDLAKHAHYLGLGKEIKMKTWNVDNHTFIFISRTMDKKTSGQLPGYLYEIPSNKTVNVKIVKKGNAIALAPNAYFGDLNESNINIYNDQGKFAPIKMIKKDGMPELYQAEFLVIENVPLPEPKK